MMFIVTLGSDSVENANCRDLWRVLTMSFLWNGTGTTAVGKDTLVKVRVSKQWFGRGSQWSSTESEQVSSMVILGIISPGICMLFWWPLVFQIGMYV